MSSKTGSQTKLTLQNLHEQLSKLKQPFLRQANQTAKQFQQKVREHGKKIIEHQQYQQKAYIQQNQIKPVTFEKPKQNKQERPKNLVEEKSIRNAQPNFQEWRSNVQHGFKDYEEIVKNYDDVIYRKQKVKKAKNDEAIEDFRADERQMVLQIYDQLKDHKNLTISFKAIQQFFQNHDLFYYFYNIHPYRLISLLQQSAKKFKDRLTKQQFVDFFQIDRPNVAQFKAATQKKLSGACILPQQIWKKLKSIFDTLDTFGDQKICIKTFFQKIKNNPSSLSLLSSEAIQFPKIGRVYTLQKILFDLENKVQFENKVDWQTIQDTIMHFSHIQQPALDVIFRNKIEKAQITKDSNYFLLEPNALNIIKQIFNRCPKHYGYFVKTSFFTFELLQTGILKPYLSQATRLDNSTKNSYLTLEYIIKNFSKQAPQYIDLDQMLELISIKGYQNSKKLINLYDQVETESSEQENQQRRKQRRLKKIKSLQDLKKNKKKEKKKPVCQITKIKQFNLFERQTPTIRQLKVQQMIEQKQRQEDIQLNKKFKANPIPVSLNTERYQRYTKLLQQKKEAIMNRLGMKRQQDQIIIDYLKSNTKLFDEKKTKRHCGQIKQNYRFEASPLPAHISEQLLPKIEAQKQERRKKIEEQTKKKYEEIYWKQIKNSLQFERDDESLLQKINSIEQQKRKGISIKPKQVPNFEQLQRKFEQQLHNRRLKFVPTEVKQFKLSSPKPTKIKQNLSPQPHHFKSVSPPKFDQHVEIKSTKKYEDWVAYNQARMAEKQLTDMQKQRQEQERQIKQKNFAKFMRKYLDNCADNTELLKHKSQEKLRNYRQNVRKLEEKTGNELAEIYARVLQRPFLFEQAAKTRKSPKQKPTKVHIQSNMPEQQQNYPYKQGLFEKQEGSQYHPVQSENLNQSF